MDKKSDIFPARQHTRGHHFVVGDGKAIVDDKSVQHDKPPLSPHPPWARPYLEGKTKNFFEVIARCLIDSQVNEAYVFVGQQISGLGPADINQAIQGLSIDEGMPPVTSLSCAYQMLHLPAGASCLFGDGVSTFLDVQGIIVEFSIAKIGADDWRVFFRRVDARELLATTQSRLSAVERQLNDLKTAVEAK